MSRLRDGILPRLIPWLGYWVLRGLRSTMRIEVVNGDGPDAFWRTGKNFIIAFWHGRQLMMPAVYGGKKISILISRHRDGELIARAVGYFGFHSVRGSTTRGGAAALKQLIRSARAGDDLAVTPDGPRGPNQVVQLGVMELAKLTGLPIIPVTFGASKKKIFGAGMVF
ncbi:MAG: lysophospholipid acyltransferase family protein [Nitrospirae bacterium]|nr:lysophospholipid acyltransferase family protein [Nitrospirota bacterium]